MTAEHTSDIESGSKPEKNTRRSASKTTARTKKTSSKEGILAESETSQQVSAEKKKAPVRRPRKKTPSPSLDSPQESFSEASADVASDTANATFTTEDVVTNKVVKSRVTRGRKPSTRSKSKEEKNTAQDLKGEAASVTALQQPEAVQEIPAGDNIAEVSTPPKRGRGRIKKAVEKHVESADTVESTDNISIVAEPQSAGVEREVTEIPDTPSLREERKTRRPRRSAKAKNIEPITKITASHIVDTEPTMEEVALADEALENEQDGENSPAKSRRGRRGGRGKRGKKRALSSIETLQHDLDDEAEEDFSLQSKKASVPTKAGTSLGEGKPGRARTLPAKKAVETVQRKMFISMVQGEQVEVALVENGVIHEYYLEMLHQVKTKGNIYKGVVNNIDANLQAAFVNYGAHKNGFLQIDEIHPEYYQSHHEATKGKKFPPIQKIIKPGQEILVQVVKEPTGNKGAFLTTWLSLPGRFLVLTPGQEQIGVSRKVESDEERVRLREMMTGIEPGAGLGVIVRTVSAGTSKTTLKSDLQYLKRVWRDIRKRGVSDVAPILLYRESGLAERAIRDYLTDDVTEVWVDNTEIAERLRETVSLLFPRKKELIRMHADVRQTLWERFNMHRQLEQIYAREVVLPSGGRLVFDQTEALMAIDINSGKISGKGNFESMALKTNIEAAEAIARHLKLRDIGGQVVIDFIEMRDKSHVREVEKTLRNAMKNDRARHDVARISSFGLLEIVRQRTGSSALAITMEPCPHCRGTGVRRNLEWQALQALCEMERKGRSAQNGKYIYETSFTELALYLLNNKRQRISELEEQLRISIEVRIP